MMIKLILLPLIVIVFSRASSAQTLDVAKLDSLFNSLDVHDFAMGSIAISRNSVPQYRKAIGSSFIDSAKEIPSHVNTKYRIGSASKMFTAVMIFQLMEEKKVALNHTLDSFFPNLPNADRITIGNLLNHRSGLHNYTEDTGYPEWMDQPKSHKEMLGIVISKGADFEPNSSANYSNSNFLILSYIVESLDSMPYHRALHKRITSKIGLLNTYYGQRIDINNNESFSYKRREKEWIQEKETDLSIHSGAGSIVSTPTDLVTFIEALFSYKLVGKESLDMMKTMIDGYGMGMFSYSFTSKTGFGHNGRLEEFYTALRYFPEDTLAFAYCTNGIVYPRTDILDGVMKICFNEPYTVPSFTPIDLKSVDLNNYLGTYTSSQPPLTVICSIGNSKLLLETKGNVIAAEPIGTHYFMQAQYGYFFEFVPESEELMIKETDNVYYLKKVK